MLYLVRQLPPGCRLQNHKLRTLEHLRLGYRMEIALFASKTEPLIMDLFQGHPFMTLGDRMLQGEAGWDDLAW